MPSLVTPLCGALCCALLPLAVPSACADTPWHPVPIRDTAYAAPLLGGEGGQVITAFAVESGPNPDSFFMSTNTGGIYRSTDGVTWEKCNVGLTGQGGYAFALDPKNDHRVLVAYGSDNTAASPLGVAFSSNRGASWTRSPAPSFSPAHTANVLIPRERRSLA